MRSIILCLLVFTSTAFAKSRLDWQKDYELAVKAAKKERKDIFLLFTNPYSCGYCKVFDNRVLADRSFQRFLSLNFVLIKADYTRVFDKSKGANVSRSDIHKELKLPKELLLSEGWPYVVIVDKNGKVKYHSVARNIRSTSKYKRELSKASR